MYIHSDMVQIVSIRAVPKTGPQKLRLLLTILNFSESQSYNTFYGLFVRVPLMNKGFRKDCH